MADLEAIIGAAVDRVESGGDAPAETIVGDVPDVEDAGEEVVADGAEEAIEQPEGDVEPDPTKAKEPKTKEPTADDELEALLEEHGIGKLKPGQKDNPIPYTRHRKIVGNALRKLRDGMQLTLKEKDVLLSTSKNRLDQIDLVDRMIANDPERYMLSLASIHPNLYGKYIKGGQVDDPKATAAAKLATDDPEPQPDVKFSDNTVGFSPEQHKKLMDWNRRQAVREAEERVRADYDKRLGPIEAEHKAQQKEAERLPRIRAEIANLHETWGQDVFKANEKAILAELQANDDLARQGKATWKTLTQIANKVLAKAAAVDRNTMREGLIKELNAAPKAPTKPAKVKATGKDPAAPRSLEDVINDAIDAAGLTE